MDFTQLIGKATEELREIENLDGEVIDIEVAK